MGEISKLMEKDVSDPDVQNQFLDYLQGQINFGFDVNYKPSMTEDSLLELFADDTYVNYFKWLLDNGADKNILCQDLAPSQSGHLEFLTIADNALQNQNYKIAKLLIERQANYHSNYAIKNLLSILTESVCFQLDTKNSNCFINNDYIQIYNRNKQLIPLLFELTTLVCKQNNYKYYSKAIHIGQENITIQNFITKLVNYYCSHIYPYANKQAATSLILKTLVKDNPNFTPFFDPNTQSK